MNFETIENLSQDEILELYDNTIEYKIADRAVLFEQIICNNGNSGYFSYVTENDSSYKKEIGEVWYGVGVSTQSVCGYNQWGSAIVVANYVDTENGSIIEQIRCNNGNSGYFIYKAEVRADIDGCYAGRTYYGGGHSMDAICGYGLNGTAIVLPNGCIKR